MPRAATLEVAVDRDDAGVCWVRLEGDLDAATSSSLRQEMVAAVGAPSVAFDLTGARIADSAGLGALLGGIRCVHEAGGVAVIVGPTPADAETLRRSGLDFRVAIVADRAGARAHLEPAPSGPSRGHRTLPDVADLVIEAWAPTPEECFEEAVAGLVGSFVPRRPCRPSQWVSFELGPGLAEDLLASLLDEAIFTVEVRGLVPCRTRIDEYRGRVLRGAFGCLPADGMSAVGPVPKAVSFHALRFARQDGCWMARATVDV